MSYKSLQGCMLAGDSLLDGVLDNLIVPLFHHEDERPHPQEGKQKHSNETKCLQR